MAGCTTSISRPDVFAASALNRATDPDQFTDLGLPNRLNMLDEIRNEAFLREGV